MGFGEGVVDGGEVGGVVEDGSWGLALRMGYKRLQAEEEGFMFLRSGFDVGGLVLGGVGGGGGHHGGDWREGVSASF